MKLGFTGTKDGMTAIQKQIVERLIKSAKPEESHMGDCIGADTDFYYLIKAILPNCKTIGHIPEKDKTRSFLKYDIETDPRPYLVRDKDIVDASDIMIGTPKGAEILRSGTWATLRYSKKQGKRTIIVYPNGKIEVVKEK
jgi:hypothetical protein